MRLPWQRLDARPERPRRLQTGRSLADRALAAGRAACGVYPGLDHDRPQLRQLNDLTAPHPPLPGLREDRPAPQTRRRPTAHDHVRSGAPPTEPLMPLLWPALLLPPLGPIRLVPGRWRNRRVARPLRRAARPGL